MSERKRCGRRSSGDGEEEGGSSAALAAAAMAPARGGIRVPAVRGPLAIGRGRAESCGSPAVGYAADGADGEHSIIDVHEDLQVRKCMMTIKNATNYHGL